MTTKNSAYREGYKAGSTAKTFDEIPECPYGEEIDSLEAEAWWDGYDDGVEDLFEGKLYGI